MERSPRTANELMTTAQYSFQPDVPVTDAAGRLLRERHSGAPVVDYDGRFLSVLSEIDLIRALTVVERGELPTETVGQIMSDTPVTVRRNTSVYDLAAFFLNNPMRRVPVVEDGILLGLVARRDVLQALSRIGLEASKARANNVAFVP